MNPPRHGPREPFRSLVLLSLAGLAIALGGCGGGVAPSRVASVVIRPGALLLTAVGETAELTAEVLDGAGDPVDLEVAWSSSDPSLVAVDADGELTVTGPLGSALVTATAGGVTSFPTTVVVAEPVSGAVLVHDDQVVAPPADVSGTSDPIRQRVVLSGPDDLEPGDVIVGAEEVGIGGAVESVTPAPDGYEVVYAPLPPQDLFAKLLVDLDMDLAAAPVVPVEDLAAAVRVRPAGHGVSEAAATTAAPVDLKIECEGASTLATVSGLNTTFENGLHYHVHVSEGIADPVPTEFYVDGKLTQKITGGLSVKAGFTGTYTCTAKLFKVDIPIGGALSLVASPSVPIGVALSAQGSLTLAGITLDMEETDGLDIDAGFEYDEVTGVKLHDEFKPIHEGPKLVLDVVTPAGFRVGLQGFFGLASGIDLKVIGLDPISIVQAQAGIQQSFDLAGPEAQAASSAYASAYDLSLVANVGIGTDLMELVEWLKLKAANVQPAQIQSTLPVSKSPRGKLTASTTAPSPGEEVHLHVKLDADTLTYLGHYNVSKVEIYRARGTEEPGVFRVIEVTGSSQADFDTVWDTAGEAPGDYRFYAFVVDDLLSKVVEVPLEVDGNSEVVVHLGGACTDELSAPLAPASSCTGTTTWDYERSNEANGIAVETHVTASGLEWEQNADDPSRFDLVAATVTWTDDAEYIAPCSITSSGTDVTVTNTDAEAGSYVTGVILLLPDGTYYGSGYVYLVDAADDGCFGGTSDETVPLFVTGDQHPTLIPDGSGGSFLTGFSSGTDEVNGYLETSWSFHFPDLPPTP